MGGVCGDQELVLGIEFRLWPSVRCRPLPSHLTHDLLVVTSKAAGMLLVFMVVFAHHVLLQLGERLFLGVRGQHSRSSAFDPCLVPPGWVELS